MFGATLCLPCLISSMSSHLISWTGGFGFISSGFFSFAK